MLDFGDRYEQNMLFHSNNFWKCVNVCTMPFWYNTNICVQLGIKPIIVYNWYKHGIKTVNDFLIENGQLLKQYDCVQNIVYNAIQQC